MPADRDDWRRTGQERYLMGATLERRRFASPPHNPNWDHEHCSLCWAKFMTDVPSWDPTVLTEGYVSEDDKWVCDQCFEDFRDEFKWTVARADPFG